MAFQSGTLTVTTIADTGDLQNFSIFNFGWKWCCNFTNSSCTINIGWIELYHIDKSLDDKNEATAYNQKEISFILFENRFPTTFITNFKHFRTHTYTHILLLFDCVHSLRFSWTNKMNERNVIWHEVNTFPVETYAKAIFASLIHFSLFPSLSLVFCRFGWGLMINKL